MAKKKQDTRVVQEHQQEAFARLVSADRIKNMAEKRKDAEAGVLYNEWLEEFATELYERGHKPSNPKYGMYDQSGRLDMTAIFQVQSRFTFNLPERRDGDDMPLEQQFSLALQDAGLTEEVANQLVQKELHIAPSLTLQLDKLLFGEYVEGEWQESSPPEKSAGAKIQRNLLATEGEELYYLNPEEQAVIKEMEKETARVKPGFFERIHQYVDGAEQLMAVLKIIVPVKFVSRCDCGLSMTPEQKNRWLGEQAQQMIGLHRDNGRG